MSPLLIEADGPSLSEILAMVGWRREVDGDGHRVFDAAGCDLGDLNGFEVTAELVARDLVTFQWLTMRDLVDGKGGV